METNFIVSARKYRPQTFESVVGQKSITITLKNAIKTSQLAHAYLFCGPRGVGKTTCARIFAKTINCKNLTQQAEACNECDSCKGFNTKRSINIHELDAASNNSVDDIRKLIEQVRIPPQIGKYSVYIIDEVHMLSTQAFNAFLKTLEEPPEHAIFILATTEKHKILPTILSRCQIFDFNRIQVADITKHLLNISQKEEITAEPEALSIIAQKADGALRDALSFYDQIASFADKKITYKKVIQSLNVLDYEFYFNLTNCFLNADYAKALIIFDEILFKGFDAHNFIVGLSMHFRDLLVSKDAVTLQLLEISHSIREKYKLQSQQTSVPFLLKSLDIVAKTDVEHKMAKNKRLHVELMLLLLCQLSKTPETSSKTPEISSKTPETSSKTPEISSKTPETSSIPSIANLLNETKIKKSEAVVSEIQQAETQENKANNKKISIDELKKYWLDFAEKYKVSEPRLYAVLSEYEIKLENQTIHLKVSTQDQLGRIEKQKNKIIRFLNEAMNADLKINIEKSTEPIKSQKPYTREEKYEFLKGKNSELDTLKNQFRLFLD